MIKNQKHAQKLMEKTKFTAAEGYVCVSKSDKPTQLESIGRRLNLIGVPKDKEVIPKVGISRILGEPSPEMTVWPGIASPGK
jgi:hypothetical protein